MRKTTLKYADPNDEVEVWKDSVSREIRGMNEEKINRYLKKKNKPFLEIIKRR
ncbi:MAG: hypothetical protein ISS45_09615 [Candidatus Omnitrophica bacterium]|nr:hypothetical protein [Candidatus Omnitrophota bacterium]